MLSHYDISKKGAFMKKNLLLAVCCTGMNITFVYSNQTVVDNAVAAAEKTFRTAIAKVILENAKKFPNDLVEQAQKYQTLDGYKKLLTDSHNLKKNPAISETLNQKLKKGTDVMENIIHEDPSVRKRLIGMMDMFEDESQINRYVNDKTSEKEFSADDIATLKDALSQEGAAAAPQA
jgi:hypothetical protein